MAFDAIDKSPALRFHFAHEIHATFFSQSGWLYRGGFRYCAGHRLCG